MKRTALYLVDETIDMDLRRDDPWLYSWASATLEDINQTFLLDEATRRAGNRDPVGCQLRMDVAEGWLEVLAFRLDESERRLWLLCDVQDHLPPFVNRLRVWAPQDAGLMFGALQQLVVEEQ